MDVKHCAACRSFLATYHDRVDQLAREGVCTESTVCSRLQEPTPRGKLCQRLRFGHVTKHEFEVSVAPKLVCVDEGIGRDEVSNVGCTVVHGDRAGKEAVEQLFTDIAGEP